MATGAFGSTAADSSTAKGPISRNLSALIAPPAIIITSTIAIISFCIIFYPEEIFISPHYPEMMRRWKDLESIKSDENPFVEEELAPLPRL